MKKIKINGKLGLHKETITKLNPEQLQNVAGGGPFTTQGPCYPSFVSQCQCHTAQVTGCTGALSGCTVC